MKKFALFLCFLPNFALAEQVANQQAVTLTEQQVADLQQQVVECNTDPQPMYGACGEAYEKLKQHFGSYEVYRAAMAKLKE